jgi:purine-binding chemotaxis protein CheW
VEETTKINEQYCGFKVGDDFFAISVLRVQEIIRSQQLTQIPKCPEMIKGLINLRGQIVTAVSLRSMFALEECTKDDQMNIIVQIGEDLYAIIVDEIMDVIEVGDETFEATPDNIDKRFSRFITGVHKLKDKLLIILDLDKVLAMEEA